MSDVIHITVSDPDLIATLSEQGRECLTREGRSDVLLIVTTPDVSIGTLDEDAMQEKGWVRVEKLEAARQVNRSLQRKLEEANHA